MRRARYVPLAICVALALAPARLAAQWQMTGDVGAAQLRQAGIPESGAFMLGGTAERLGDRAAFRSSVLAARASADRWTMQGLAIGSLLGAPRGATQWELTALAGAFAATNDNPTVSGEVMPRFRVVSSGAGGALGLGGGVLSHNGSVRPLLHAQVDGWWSAGRGQLLGELSAVRTEVARARLLADEQIIHDRLEYIDLIGGWRRDVAGLSLGAQAGVRGDLGGSRSSDAWASVDAALWMTRRAALVLGAGRTLEDVVRGVPRTRFVSLALRIAAQPHVPFRWHGAPAGLRLALERRDGGRARVDVLGATEATRVELMADFTDWQPVGLERSGDAWRTSLSVAPGLHRVAIRVDGGEWVSPRNLQRVTDDLGGTVGLITIP